MYLPLPCSSIWRCYWDNHRVPYCQWDKGCWVYSTSSKSQKNTKCQPYTCFFRCIFRTYDKFGFTWQIWVYLAKYFAININYFRLTYYSGVIMSPMACHITSMLTVCSAVCSGAHQNIQIPRHWPLCGNPPATGGFPSKGASNVENASIWWFDDVIMSLNDLTCKRGVLEMTIWIIVIAMVY